MDIEQRLQKAQVALERDALDEAAEIYEAILYETPEQVDALKGVSRIALSTEQFYEAQRFAERALQFAPKDAEALLLQGLSFEEEEPNRAIEMLLAATKKAKDEPLLHYHLARILAKQGYPEDALVQVTIARKLVPEDLDILLLSGRIYRDLGAAKEGLEAFQTAIDLAPHQITAYVELAELLLQQGEVGMALETLQVGRECTGQDIPVLYREMGIAAAQGNWQGALRKADLLTRRLPDSAQAWISFGLLSMMQKDFSRAEKAFENAREVEPSAWQPDFHLGDLYYAGGLADKAVQHFNDSIRKDPQAWSPKNNLALLLLAEAPHRLGEAIELLKETVALAPEEPAPLLNLGLACLKAGDVESANRACRALLGGAFVLEDDLRQQGLRLAKELGITA
ncbi:MAG: tetratricopeptide repeat protein [Myxococcales bacterium]|nr:tetratricopeptide repeat protein [Myxococcales bacterium]